MRSGKLSRSLIERAAFEGLNSDGKPSGGIGEGACDEAGRREGRRRECRSLEKHVASAMKRICDGRFVLRRGVLLEHAPETSNPTTWVDSLAASPFGAFVISQHDWTGSVTRSTNYDELLVHDNFGVASVQTSPVRRAKPALRYLRAMLAQYDCPVDYIAVFPDRYCALDPALPEAILQCPELYHFMRTRLNRFCDSQSRFLDAHRIAAEM
ncbi:nuclease-related domain-containing protein [Paraburkholderia hospita]|uniref:nuclease-related domain-containing protein n=1 Tax=Paraburkholderia hospita TaxID=169430 RepID=UPI003ED05BE2